MLLQVDVESKSIGNKKLFQSIQFSVEPKEKIAIIGRNGIGKTTLFRMLTGQDTDYEGLIRFKRGTVVISTDQEHEPTGNKTTLAYVLDGLPEYAELKHIIDTYPNKMGENLTKINTYSNALERFSSLGYYSIEENILNTLAEYQITAEMANSPMDQLSGGQKRFAELTKIEHAKANIALIDEPTNHMDYFAKESFIKWLKSVKHAVVVISHDRDLLHEVDKIIEIKDQKAHVSKGNYEAYLKQNTLSTTAQINDYEVGLRTMENLKKQIAWAKSRKPSWHGTADQRNPFVVMERRLQKEYDQLMQNMKKPNFWIDQESAAELNKKISTNYEKYKTKNIKIHKNPVNESSRVLLRVENLTLGYSQTPLFNEVSFYLAHSNRLQLKGRNGVGKTTLLKTIVALVGGKKAATVKTGDMTWDKQIRLSVYEQEVTKSLLDLNLHEAIEKIYQQSDLQINNERIMQLMGDYLFNPYEDGRLKVSQLSGGQKARLQIIRMMANNPNFLILDEPTNHLDLPSIEELEKSLLSYDGALLYVSHDSYFAKNIGGDTLELTTYTGD